MDTPRTKQTLRQNVAEAIEQANRVPQLERDLHIAHENLAQQDRRIAELERLHSYERDERLKMERRAQDNLQRAESAERRAAECEQDAKMLDWLLRKIVACQGKFVAHKHLALRLSVVGERELKDAIDAALAEKEKAK